MEVLRDPKENRKHEKRLKTPKAQYPTKDSATKTDKKKKLLSIMTNQIKMLDETELDQVISVFANESGKNVFQKMLKL